MFKAAHSGVIEVEEFSVKIIEMLVQSATREGDFVLDPFLGSGTTALACQNLNRNFAGIEIEYKYIEMAESRLQKTQADLFKHIAISA